MPFCWAGFASLLEIYVVPFKLKEQGICSSVTCYTCFFICMSICKGLTDSTSSSMNQIPSKTDLDNLGTAVRFPGHSLSLKIQVLGWKLNCWFSHQPCFLSGIWLWLWSVILRPNTHFYLLQPLTLSLGYRSLCPACCPSLFLQLSSQTNTAPAFFVWQLLFAGWIL